MLLFGLALVLGFIAARLRVPVLVGYMIAGFALGPASPGFVSNLEFLSFDLNLFKFVLLLVSKLDMVLQI